MLFFNDREIKPWKMEHDGYESEPKWDWLANPCADSHHSDWLDMVRLIDSN